VPRNIWTKATHRRRAPETTIHIEEQRPSTSRDSAPVYMSKAEELEHKPFIKTTYSNASTQVEEESFENGYDKVASDDSDDYMEMKPSTTHHVSYELDWVRSLEISWDSPPNEVLVF